MFINYNPVKGQAVSGTSNPADIAYTRRDAEKLAQRAQLRKVAVMSPRTVMK